jgi:hypothetical protein
MAHDVGRAARRRGRSRRLVAALALVLVTAGGCGSSGGGGERESGQAGVEAGAKSSTSTTSSEGVTMPAAEREKLRSPGAATTLTDLSDMDQFTALYDQHQDVPRLILLLSPT